jgi:hypothetical protein
VRSVLGKRILGAVGMLIGTLGFIGIVLTVYLRIRAGHGTDAFQNQYGQYETWASYAGFLIGAPLLLLGLYLVRCWQLWRRSRLEGIPTKELIEELKRNL